MLDYTPRYVILTITGLMLAFIAPAQQSGKLIREADHALKEGDLATAAELYEQAGRLKGGKSEAMYQAGECYYNLRDYNKAAECYKSVRNIFSIDEFSGLRYARTLKQSGRCQEAVEAFKSFIYAYKGSLKAQIVGVVQNEIKGCDLATNLVNNQESTIPVFPVEIELLPPSVNVQGVLFAPIPYSERLLYFSQIYQNETHFLRARKQDNQWLPAEEAIGLPETLVKKFGNGAFSPDGNRFYCTQCKESGPGKSVRCQIFLVKKQIEGWSEPAPLPDYINMPGMTTLHPFVAFWGGKELLFFASNRPGGFGGMDLYWSERNRYSEELDFSLPQNLGAPINTGGDELSPFFDVHDNALWFSSNGQVTLGGLDIFVSHKEDGAWGKVENPGYPLNSPADDLFFIKKKSGVGGYLVSNRLFGEAKNTTREQKIFEFIPKQAPQPVNGIVVDAQNNQLLNDCLITVYELKETEEKQMLEVKVAGNGRFKVLLFPYKHYILEVSKPGYYSKEVTSFESDNLEIVLQRIK